MRVALFGSVLVLALAFGYCCKSPDYDIIVSVLALLALFDVVELARNVTRD